jgi:class 3 adenylate cyclase/tetratricopeptide (TPR) repeat protein
MECGQCQHTNPGDARFCMQCGAQLGLCGACGGELPPEALFCPACGEPREKTPGAKDPSEAPGSVAHPSYPGAPPDGAERRQLTVMFCDVVDSTELSELLDPEDYREALAAYQRICGEKVERYGGWVAQYLGDGLLVYFGYPQAHEDDPVRAVDAALNIQAALPELNVDLEKANALFRDRPMQLRLCVHTGPVVVGEMGMGDRLTELALGDTVNLTFRLLDHANPGDVVYSESTGHLCEGLFQVEALGAKSLKGIAEPVSLFRVDAANDARSRLDVAAARGLGQLAGRGEELALLLGRWEAAKEGAGQGFVVSGEAGMGKSRLVLAFREHIESETHGWIECRCSPYGEGSAFEPVVSALEHQLGFQHGETPDERLEKLDVALRATDLDIADVKPLIASLLSLPMSEDYPLPSVRPEVLRKQLLGCIAVWLEASSALRPTVLVLEDLHWADPSTLELLELLLERASSARVLVILTHRPEFQPPWPARGHISQIAMQRLAREQSAVVIANAAKGKTLPGPLVDEILARTDGVPLFLEELTRALLESELVEEHETEYVLQGEIEELAAPATLQDSLMARLDRLGSAKATAQLASVLGREFQHSLLEVVSLLAADALDAAIDRLAEADLLYRAGVPPHASYRFRHALIQDVAYRSLLNRTRHGHHARVAAALEERFPEVVEAHSELVARHYEEAQKLEAALPFWERAASRAVDRSAYVEGASHATRALAVLGQLPEPTDPAAQEERAARELALQLLRGGAVIATRGHGDPQVQRSYERARELCKVVPDVALVSQALVGLSAYYVTIGEIETSHELGEQLLQIAATSGQDDVKLAAHLTIGIPLCFRGEPADSMDHLERAISFYDPSQHRVGAYVSGQDPGVVARSFSAWAHWLAGFPDQARARVEEGIELAALHEDPFSQAFAMGCAGPLYCLRRDDYETLERRAIETIALCDEHGFPLFLGLGRCSLGWALARHGDEEGIQELERGIALFESSGSILRTLGAGLHADALCRVGRSKEASMVVRAALSTPKRATFWDAELLRLEGESLRLSGAPDSEALDCYERSLEVARRQGARTFALRSCLDIARLLQKQGRGADARAALADIYSTFEEGHGTEDLREAQVLLDTLS